MLHSFENRSITKLRLEESLRLQIDFGPTRILFIYLPIIQNCREILMEIQRLKLEQANQAAGIAAAMRDGAIKNFAQPKPTEQEDPQLVAELNALRQRKSELEARMNDLQVGGMFLDLTKAERTLGVTSKAEGSVIRPLKALKLTSPSMTAKYLFCTKKLAPELAIYHFTCRGILITASALMIKDLD